MKQSLAPTDSRFRPDRLFLEMGDMEQAGREKVKLENDQRVQRKKREEKNERWKPRYFKKEVIWVQLKFHKFDSDYLKIHF